MLDLRFNFEGKRSPKILCLGAHCDDIEIGCGGAILHLTEKYPGSVFDWVVFSSNERRSIEAKGSAEAFLAGAANRRVVIKDYKESFFPFIGEEIKCFFEEVKRSCQPDLVLTHYRDDRHQDHRLISDLTWNTFRDHLILEYEIPKYDGDLGQPNLFIPLTRKISDMKIKLLEKYYASQKSKPWFDDETFRAMMRLRGVECNAPENYAEAFYCRKLVL